MIIGGILLLITAAVCFFFARSQRNKLDAMNATDTYTSAMLAALHNTVSTSIGADALAEKCEVEGVIECEAPLTSPVTGTPCVAYSYTVSREYEEDVTETDAEGRKTTRVQSGSETVESHENKVDFWVRDDTGRTLVRPEQADLDLESTSDKFEPVEQARDGTLRLGLVNVNIEGSKGKRRTKGYRATEQVLQTGIRVYVLGCASDYQGQPSIGAHPRGKDARFMVSRRLERDLANSAAAWSKNLYFAAAGSGALGLLLLVLGLISSDDGLWLLLPTLGLPRWSDPQPGPRP